MESRINPLDIERWEAFRQRGGVQHDIRYALFILHAAIFFDDGDILRARDHGQVAVFLKIKLAWFSIDIHQARKVLVDFLAIAGHFDIFR